MDPFVIIFAALLLIAWLVADAHDRRAKRKIENATTTSHNRSDGQEKSKRADRATRDS
ncbi:MAG TPA: hypothetical protein VNN73_20530 [Blastocatellia bacterium]|nr:hypothetical protein [Blastocatellia bacterium]